MSPTLSAGERLDSSAQGMRNPSIFRPEADLLAPSLHGSGWDVSGSGVRGGSDWTVDIAALSAVYSGRSEDHPASQAGFAFYGDAADLWEAVPDRFGKDWEIDLGSDGPYGKGRAPGKKSRTY
jgi:hypothetical protein